MLWLNLLSCAAYGFVVLLEAGAFGYVESERWLREFDLVYLLGVLFYIPVYRNLIWRGKPNVAKLVIIVFIGSALGRSVFCEC